MNTIYDHWRTLEAHARAEYLSDDAVAQARRVFYSGAAAALEISHRLACQIAAGKLSETGADAIMRGLKDELLAFWEANQEELRIHE